MVVLTTGWHVERSMLCFAAAFSDAPNVTLLDPEVVPSDPKDHKVVSRKAKERMLIENWIPLCLAEEKGHPDMPGEGPAIAALFAMKSKITKTMPERTSEQTMRQNSL